MLAKRLPTILPDMNFEESLETMEMLQKSSGGMSLGYVSPLGHPLKRQIDFRRQGGITHLLG